MAAGSAARETNVAAAEPSAEVSAEMATNEDATVPAAPSAEALVMAALKTKAAERAVCGSALLRLSTGTLSGGLGVAPLYRQAHSVELH